MTSRRDILLKPYLNIKETGILLGLKPKPASELFHKILAIEKEKEGEFKVYPNKIKKFNALKYGYTTFNQVLQEIELEEEQIKNA